MRCVLLVVSREAMVVSNSRCAPLVNSCDIDVSMLIYTSRELEQSLKCTCLEKNSIWKKEPTNKESFSILGTTSDKFVSHWY